MRAAAFLVVAGCGGQAVGVDASADAFADESIASPTTAVGVRECSARRLDEVCASLGALEDDAMRCTYGSAVPQCTQTVARIYFRGHVGAFCPLVVTDASSDASQAYAVAISQAIQLVGACKVCSCDLACDIPDADLACIRASECKPDGHCRQAWEMVDAGAD